MPPPKEIYSFRGEYQFLSNFYPCAVEYDGLVFKSLESAFQAAKCDHPADRAQFQPLGAAEAKRVGRSIKLRGDWERVKLPILSQLVILKFATHPALLERLLSTGDANLSEGNTWHDNFYGNCSCERCRDVQGQNHLGRTLMAFRDKLRKAIQSYTETGGN